ncbi:hypothetical protein [Streptomyces lavendulae]|uniref:hypothetical protein n=1 Tax=Streptomyces lavendulae TaxID=1914 RepID=UPI0033D4F04D
MKIQILPPAEPHRSTVYPDWAAAHDPARAADAAALFAEALSTLHTAYEKPGRYVDGLERLVRTLEPAHLPWFWDTLGHRLIPWHLRSAARAHALARKAEQAHRLPVDPDWHRANLLLFARAGALPATAIGTHQTWLTATLDPRAAHEEFVRFLEAWAASPGEPPADLARRLRISARAAGAGTAEEARVLGALLGAAHGKDVPDRLLDAATALLTEHPPADDTAALLLDLFPESRGDASAWLRLLLACGAADAAAAGRIVPEGGLDGWFARYTHRFGHGRSGSGIMRQPMPAELFELLTRWAPRLRAAAPLRLHEDRYRHPGLDADLLDACLAEGIAVEDPGPAVRLEFRDGRSRRDLKALAADPVFGPRLEGTVHEALRTAGSAITRLPHNAGIAAGVHGRVEALLDALRGGGLAAADEAVDELHGLLDRPTARALDGIEEALAGLDLTGPLGRALRAGLPEEFGWPALDEAVAELGGPDRVVGVTSTWPVLTVYGPDRAFAVDHAGRRDACAFRIPGTAPRPAATPDEPAAAAPSLTVHHIGGQFLVAWSDAGNNVPDRAFWTDHPEDVFEPEQTYGLRRYGGMVQNGLGYQFATPDGTGRHDGRVVLRPGGRGGIGHHDVQMSDGTRFWSARTFCSWGSWTRVDPDTGERGTDRTPPAFHTATEPPPGTRLFGDVQSLAVLPPGAPASPLGQDGRLVGFRVLHRTPYAGPSPREFLLQGTDGRSASYRSRRPGRRPWAVLRMPAGGEDAVLAGEETVRCHSAEDNSLLWQVHGFPGSDRRRAPGFGDGAGPVPPPAFWHFLTPRDETSSHALRTVAEPLVRDLLDAAVREDPAPALPGALEPRIAEGVARAAHRAADVLRRRRALSRRVALLRAEPAVSLRTEVPDTELTPALLGLLPDRRRHHGCPEPQPQPALLTAVAADGRHLRGEIDEETRLLALPADPAPWQPLVGRIGAVAWRACAATTPDADRAALAALLETWSGQPFAEPGSTWRTGRAAPEALAAVRSAGHPLASTAADGGGEWFLQRAADPEPDGAEDRETLTVDTDDTARLPRLLELLAERGPLTASPAAREAFARLTGVRGPVAALVLAGFPRREDHGEHQRLLGGPPYKATKAMVSAYDELCRALGAAGRRAVLAAGLPQDPADLWEPAGTTAAAERMAAAWNGLLGAEEPADEELAAALEAELGLHESWARSLPAGRAPQAEPFGEDGFLLTRDRRGALELRYAEPDGTAGRWVAPSAPAHRTAATVIAWALTERPVGDPARSGALLLHRRLREQLAGPGALIPLGKLPGLGRSVPTDPAFSRYRGTVLPGTVPMAEGAEPDTVHADGTLLVGAPSGETFLWAAAFTAPGGAERAAATCGTRGPAWILDDLPRTARLLDGLDRLAARAADTPVPPGGYETDPSLSAPDLVAEVARTLGVGADAAALHLQLLALARPTDRAVRRWNGWTAARHKAAQAELVAAGAVESGKRARAGRTAFLPGEWADLKAPHLPLEKAKLEGHLAWAAGKSLYAMTLRLLAPLPPHELFARAWRQACP